jgi:YVTN family beta-propeller protein
MTFVSSRALTRRAALVLAAGLAVTVVPGVASAAPNAVIPVGRLAQGLAISPDGTRAAVANSNDNTVSVIDTQTRAVTATVPVGLYPLGVAFTPDSSRVYVTNRDAHTVSVIDMETSSVTATWSGFSYPTSIEVSGDRVHVLNEGNATLSIVDLAGVALGGVPLPEGPSGLAVTPDGAKAYVGSYRGVHVTVIDVAAASVIASVRASVSPRALAVSPDGTRVYTTKLTKPDPMKVIDVTTDKALPGGIPGPGWSLGVAVAPDGARAYITNFLDRTVSVIDTAGLTEIGRMTVGRYPTEISITPDGKQAYVLNGRDEVEILDL